MSLKDMARLRRGPITNSFRSSADDALRIGVEGESSPRFILHADGTLQIQNSVGTIQLSISTAGTVLAGAGNEDVPGYRFRSNQKSGLFSISNDELGISVNGVKILAMKNNSGVLEIGFFGTPPQPQPSALTAKDITTVNSGDVGTDDVIDNNRTRIEELETRLSDIGLLP